MKKLNFAYLLLALAISAYVSWQVIGPVLTDDTVIQDDFRQSLFWLWRNWQPDLFPNDFIADIYDSGLLRLPLLALAYGLAPLITDNLVFFTKLFAFLIALISAAFAYLYMEQASKDKFLALSFTLAMSAIFWSTDHISAAVARSFIIPFIFAYMYYKDQSRDLVCTVLCFVSLFISPIVFLICLGMEFFYLLFNNRSDLLNPKSKGFLGLALNALSALVFYKLVCPMSADYSGQYSSSPLYTLAEMKQLPEFLPGGRHPIFGSNLFDGSWWTNEHWGLGIGFLAVSKVIIVAAIILPIYYLLRLFIMKESMTQANSIFTKTSLYLFLSSISLYFAAQITFPMLYMPSRYISLSLLLLSVIYIFQILQFFFVTSFSSYVSEIVSKIPVARIKLFASSLIFLLAFSFCSYIKPHYFTRFVNMNPLVKAAIDALPVDSLIAAHPLLGDLSLVPVISKRSIFMSYEHATPSMNKDILAEVRRRNMVSMQLTYASSLDEVISLMKANHISHFMASKAFYDPRYLSKPFYIEPYVRFQIDLINSKQGKFFFNDYLNAHKGGYMIISLETLLKQ